VSSSSSDFTSISGPCSLGTSASAISCTSPTGSVPSVSTSVGTGGRSRLISCAMSVTSSRLCSRSRTTACTLRTGQFDGLKSVAGVQDAISQLVQELPAQHQSRRVAAKVEDCMVFPLIPRQMGPFSQSVAAYAEPDMLRGLFRERFVPKGSPTGALALTNCVTLSAVRRKPNQVEEPRGRSLARIRWGKKQAGAALGPGYGARPWTTSLRPAALAPGSLPDARLRSPGNPGVVATRGQSTATACPFSFSEAPAPPPRRREPLPGKTPLRWAC
jgi:hypothetical protein